MDHWKYRITWGGGAPTPTTPPPPFHPSIPFGGGCCVCTGGKITLRFPSQIRLTFGSIFFTPLLNHFFRLWHRESLSGINLFWSVFAWSAAMVLASAGTSHPMTTWGGDCTGYLPGLQNNSSFFSSKIPEKVSHKTWPCGLTPLFVDCFEYDTVSPKQELIYVGLPPHGRQQWVSCHTAPPARVPGGAPQRPPHRRGAHRVPRGPRAPGRDEVY